MFADAIKTINPRSKIVTILGDGRPDHYGVLLPNRTYADYDGPASSKTIWLKRFREAELVKRELVIKPLFLPNREIPRSLPYSQYLAGILTS